MRRPVRHVCAVLFLATAGTALAGRGQPPGEPIERIAGVQVSYQDLDLHEESGARAMLERLQRAAVTACGGNPKWYLTYEIMPKRTVDVFQSCRRNAIARAVAHIDAPLLSHLFASTYGEAGPTARDRALSPPRRAGS